MAMIGTTGDAGERRSARASLGGITVFAHPGSQLDLGGAIEWGIVLP